MPSTLAIALLQQPATTPPSVRITVTETGTPSVGTVTVVRTDPDGQTRPVRTPDGAPLPISGGVGLVTDPELPYGVPVTYSVQANNNPTASTNLPVVDVWLTHIGVPSRSVALKIVAEFADRDREPDRGMFKVMGRSRMVPVTSGVRTAASTGLVVQTSTDTERRALDLICDDSSVLLLNVPGSRAYGVDTSYISVGTLREKRLVDYALEQRRLWDLPYDVVDRPAGGTRAQITHADVSAKYARYTDYPVGFTHAQIAAGG